MMKSSALPSGRSEAEVRFCVRRHLRLGWGALLVFLTLGLVLEALHGFKLGMYLDVSNATRRLMWTLAHAHGALLGLIHLGFALTAHLLPAWEAAPRRAASNCLAAATVLLPGGFFLGGMFIHSGDPGLGILLVPVGGLLLLGSVGLVLRALRAGSAAEPGKEAVPPEARRQ